MYLSEGVKVVLLKSVLASLLIISLRFSFLLPWLRALKLVNGIFFGKREEWKRYLPHGVG